MRFHDSNNNQIYSTCRYLCQASLLLLLLLSTAACGTFDVTIEDISDVGARVTILEASSDSVNNNPTNRNATLDDVKEQAFGEPDDVSDDDDGVTVALLPTDIAVPTVAPTLIPTGVPTGVPTALPTIIPTAAPTIEVATADRSVEVSAKASRGSADESAGAPSATVTSSVPEVSVPDVSVPKVSVPKVRLPTGNVADAGMACFAMVSKGLNCLTAEGEWQAFTEQNSPLTSNRIGVLEACPDGSMLIGASGRIMGFDGSEWTEYEYRGWVPTAFHCTADGFWVGHNKGVAYFDGVAWREYDGETIAPGQSFQSANDVVIDDRGRVWVVTHSTIAMLDDGEWTIYNSETDLAGIQALDTIMIDQLGRLVIAGNRAFLTFVGDGWQITNSPLSSTLQATAFDKDNRLWMGTLLDGIGLLSDSELAGSELVTYRQENSGLSSDGVYAIMVDSANRVWIGTQWGLNVLDGDRWTAYHMNNAELHDHDIRLIAVQGAGPTLPEPLTKESGSITGRIMLDAQPQANVLVEACVEPIGFLWDGERPCSKQPFFTSTQTNDDGWFTFDELPRGAYVITYNLNGKWGQLETKIGSFSARIPVQPDEQTYLGEILLTSSE